MWPPWMLLPQGKIDGVTVTNGDASVTGSGGAEKT